MNAFLKIRSTIEPDTRKLGIWIDIVRLPSKNEGALFLLLGDTRSLSKELGFKTKPLIAEFSVTVCAKLQTLNKPPQTTSGNFNTRNS